MGTRDPLTRHSADIIGARAHTVGRTTVLPLIGREQLLRRIADAFDHTRDGGRMLVTIVGERGSGRTRMLREIRSMPELSTSIVIELRPEAGSRDLDVALERSLRDELVVRRSIGPMGIAEYLSTPQSLITTLSVCGSAIPLVLLVDDIDVTPRAAVELGEILRAIDAPWLAVVTSEHATVAASTIVGRASEANAVELLCERFDHEGVAALMRALQREEPSTCDVAWLVERTHGLPLLLREAIEAAVRCGAFSRDADRLRRRESIARAADEFTSLLPLTVPELHSLSQTESDALATVALLGERAPRRLLAELGVTETCLTRLAELRLLRQEKDDVRFESRVVHEAALAAARAASLAERHASTLATFLEEAIDAGLRPPSLTIDVLVAHAVNDAERHAFIASQLDRAGLLAGRGEYGYAAMLMGSCYNVAVATVTDPLRVAGWFEQHISVLHSLGRVDEQRRTIDDFLQRHPADTSQSALLPAIARAMLWRAEYQERGKLTESAFELLEAVDGIIGRVEGPEVANALRNRALMGRARIYMVADRNDDALAILRRILDDVDELEESQLPVAFDALLLFGRVARTPEQCAEAEQRIASMLERFERDGRERLAVQMRAARLGLHALDDDFDRFETEVRELLEATRRCSLPRTETNVWVWLAIILSERGEHDEAIQAIDHAIEARWRVGSIALWQIAMITRAQLLVAARRDDEALATIAQVELDAEAYGRPCRRFLLEVARCVIAVRRGEWQSGAAGIAALAQIGRDEAFEGVSLALLEAEGEMLLHTYSIDRERARDYARRVLVEEPATLGALRLLPVALAIVARALDDGSTAARGRIVGNDPLMLELRRRVTESLSIWMERRATANAEHSLSLLRAHSPRALAGDDVALIDARLPRELAGPSWHHCDIQTLGAIRVLDAAGSERGGRHFGQHKSDSKPKKMLAALAVAAIVGRRLKRERFIEMVWGESVTPEAAVNNFHVTLSGLRQVVGDVVDFDGTSYMLNTSLVRVDALRLIAMVDEAMGFQQAGLLFRSYDLLRSAVSLAGGEFLDGIYDEWTDGARDLVHAKTRFARLRIAELSMARGEFDVARREISALFEADALDEEAQFLHLSQIRADGERLRALREYDRFAERLATEYGSEPSARLRALRASIVSDE